MGSPNPVVQASYWWGDDARTSLKLFLGALDDESPPRNCTAKGDALQTSGISSRGSPRNCVIAEAAQVKYRSAR